MAHVKHIRHLRHLRHMAGGTASSGNFAVLVAASSPALWYRMNEANTATGGQFAHGYLSLPGRAGYYATTADAAALDFTDGFDVKVAVALDDWTPSALQFLINKRGGSNDGFSLSVLSTGMVRFSIHGVADMDSTAAPTVSDGGLLLLRASRVVASGQIKFWTKPTTAATAYADALLSTGWTQLGTTKVAAGAITANAQAVNLGADSAGTANLLAGKVYAVVMAASHDGTPTFAADLTTQNPGTVTFTESSTNAATVTVNGPIAADSSANARDAALINGVTLGSTGKVGNAATFDGVNDRGQVNGWIPASAPMTIAAWVTFALNDATDDCIFGKSRGTTTGGYYLKIEATTGKLVFGMSKSVDGVSEAKSTNSVPDDNSWVFVAATFDGTTGQTYLNGVADGSGTPLATTTTSHDALIGAFDDSSPAKFYGGKIDELFVVEGRALSATEIAALYAAR